MKRKRLRFMYEKQNGKCYYCLRKMYLGIPTDFMTFLMEATKEHKQPVSKNGLLLGKQNVVLACRACNWSKGNRTEEEFLTALKNGFQVPQPWVIKSAKLYQKEFWDKRWAERRRIKEETKSIDVLEEVKKVFPQAAFWDH